MWRNWWNNQTRSCQCKSKSNRKQPDFNSTGLYYKYKRCAMCIYKFRRNKWSCKPISTTGNSLFYDKNCSRYTFPSLLYTPKEIIRLYIWREFQLIKTLLSINVANLLMFATRCLPTRKVCSLCLWWFMLHWISVWMFWRKPRLQC